MEQKIGKGNWDEWLLWDDNGKKKNHFANQPTAAKHDFYLSGDVLRAENYVEWFNIIRNAGPNDLITFYINSYGGDMYCALQFMSAIRETEAHTLCKVEGACMSAATMIAMMCDSFMVSPESVWMVHNYSGGTVGKGGEMADQIEFERRWSAKFIEEVYEHFLTTHEIEKVLDGKDIWMDADDVIERLLRRAKAFNIDVLGNEEEIAPAPKKKVAKKKVSKKK